MTCKPEIHEALEIFRDFDAQDVFDFLGHCSDRVLEALLKLVAEKIQKRGEARREAEKDSSNVNDGNHQSEDDELEGLIKEIDDVLSRKIKKHKQSLTVVS